MQRRIVKSVVIIAIEALVGLTMGRTVLTLTILAGLLYLAWTWDVTSALVAAYNSDEKTLTLGDIHPATDVGESRVAASYADPKKEETFNGLKDDWAQVTLAPLDEGRRWHFAFVNMSGSIVSRVSMRITQLRWFKPDLGKFVETREFHSPSFQAIPLLRRETGDLLAGDKTTFRLVTSFGGRVAVHSTEAKHTIAKEHYGRWQGTVSIEWAIGTNIQYRHVVFQFDISRAGTISAPPTRPTWTT